MQTTRLSVRIIISMLGFFLILPGCTSPGKKLSSSLMVIRDAPITLSVVELQGQSLLVKNKGPGTLEVRVISDGDEAQLVQMIPTGEQAVLDLFAAHEVIIATDANVPTRVRYKLRSEPKLMGKLNPWRPK